MNPCKCGYYGDPTHTCTCTKSDISRYLDRVSGPLLDRIDLEVEVPAVTFAEMHGQQKGETTATIRERVNRARRFAVERFRRGGDETFCNAEMSPNQIRRYCALGEDAAALLSGAFESMGLSARGHDRILKVARTVADMDGSEQILLPHLAEAIQYRSLDRKYWNR